MQKNDCMCSCHQINKTSRCTSCFCLNNGKNNMPQNGINIQGENPIHRVIKLEELVNKHEVYLKSIHTQIFVDPDKFNKMVTEFLHKTDLLDKKIENLQKAMNNEAENCSYMSMDERVTGLEERITEIASKSKVYLGYEDDRIVKLEMGFKALQDFNQEVSVPQLTEINEKINKLDKSIDPFRNTAHENVWPSMRNLHKRIENLEEQHNLNINKNKDVDETIELILKSQNEFVERSRNLEDQVKLLQSKPGESDTFKKEEPQNFVCTKSQVHDGDKKIKTYWVNVYKTKPHFNEIFCADVHETMEIAKNCIISEDQYRKFIKTISFDLDLENDE